MARQNQTIARKYIPPAHGVPLGPLSISACIGRAIINATGTGLTTIAFDFSPGAFETGTIYFATRSGGGG
ncbi:hypothetical protein CC79DRAFT_1327266 [Sarocladium strictum]